MVVAPLGNSGLRRKEMVWDQSSVTAWGMMGSSSGNKSSSGFLVWGSGLKLAGSPMGGVRGGTPVGPTGGTPVLPSRWGEAQRKRGRGGDLLRRGVARRSAQVSGV